MPPHLKSICSIWLQKHELRVKPSKCHLFRTQIEYVGHVVSAENVRPSHKKIAAVQDCLVPRTVKDVRAFWGFTGYYQRFVKDFTHIVNPLLELMKGVPSGAKKQEIQWGERQEKVFQALKVALTEAPVLAYAEFSLPFILHTDGSLLWLGAVLSQVQDGKERVIAYASRSLQTESG
ncbi:uncharacterized protein [Dendrobates tinctorius]|uniref:uncharacterized protein n=1 Tax=Dendrobates tinctorius TaxID=92724 RepID=UPI003CCA4829